MTENLTMEAFNPKKAELLLIVDGYKELLANGVSDKKEYLVVDNARKDLKYKRVEIQKTGKSLREDALAFQKRVISVEKELLSIIEPTEDALEKQLKNYDDIKLIEKRKELLPERKQMLLDVNCSVEDDFILLMDDDKFSSFYITKKGEFLIAKEEQMRKDKAEADRIAEIERHKIIAAEQARKEAEQKAENDRMRLENEKKEIERKMQESIEKAKRDAELAELARINAEKEREKAVELAKLQHEKEIKEMEEKAKRDAIIAENNRKEQERIKKESEIKKQKEKKVANWLSENGYDNSDKFMLAHGDDCIKLYVLKSVLDK